MSYVGLTILHLPNFCRDGGDTREEVYVTDSMDHDPLEMPHLRCVHVSKSKLLEGHRHMLFTESGLSHKHLSKKFVKSVSRHLCKLCPKKAKITRRSFHPTGPDTHHASTFLEKVIADIAIYLNCPSPQGYKYVFVIMDVATKLIWEFPLKTRSGERLLSCVKNWVSTILPTYLGSHQPLHYHDDGGAVLIDQRIKSYLL